MLRTWIIIFGLFLPLFSIAPGRPVQPYFDLYIFVPVAFAVMLIPAVCRLFLSLYIKTEKWKLIFEYYILPALYNFRFIAGISLNIYTMPEYKNAGLSVLLLSPVIAIILSALKIIGEIIRRAIHRPLFLTDYSDMNQQSNAENSHSIQIGLITDLHITGPVHLMTTYPVIVRRRGDGPRGHACRRSARSSLVPGWVGAGSQVGKIAAPTRGSCTASNRHWVRVVLTGYRAGPQDVGHVLLWHHWAWACCEP